MLITEVRAKRVNGDNRLVGIAAITIDECFVVHELRVIEGKNGLFVAMPSRKMPNGEFYEELFEMFGYFVIFVSSYFYMAALRKSQNTNTQQDKIRE